ncbi:hypothetical protein DMC30DRAFT_413726 [Rhodotorula diobovata]|uniref:Uncharacterized protein n=1 Tax=Rhodotorula diobovata TaxID=5288 RepID=A0A5C5G4G0_9BASI|nr:hypothetical protein DMC30DRAFT_413726 [Rhodotorula diobovata]
MKLSLVLLSGLVALVSAAPLAEDGFKADGVLVERQQGGIAYGGGGHGRGGHDHDRGDHGHDRDHGHDHGRDHDRDHGHDRDRDHDRDRCHYKRDMVDRSSSFSSGDVAKRAVVAASVDVDGGVEAAVQPAQLDAEDEEFAPQSRNDGKRPHGWHHRRCYDCPRRFGYRCDRWKRWCRRRHHNGYWYWGDNDD